MKVVHCISTIDKNSGGTSIYMKLLIESLDGKIEQVLITEISENNLKIDSSANLIFLSKKEINKGFSKLDANLFHGNGLWQFPVHYMAKNALKKNIPYIISTHGMLEPWSLGQSKLKKKLAMLLFQHKDLKKATCLHATGQMEVDSIRKLGYTNPIANIPNGIQIKDFPQKTYLKKNSKRKILFLSRIHPKKGIELLITAWKSIDSNLKKDWCIDIAGNGEQSYLDTLNQIIEREGLSQEIKIIGPKFGQDKIETYHSADVFVLPTHSENFGIVVAEALSCGVPVITTKGTPWSDIEINNAGKWIDIGEEPLKIAMQELMLKSDAERESMGNNGRKLVEGHYSIESVALKMVELYKWIINSGEKPSFVYLK